MYIENSKTITKNKFKITVDILRGEKKGII